MATSASVWMGHLIVSIALTLITIASFLVLYQLFSGLCCPKASHITKPQPKKQLHTGRSNTPASAGSATSNTNNELSHSPSPKPEIDDTEPQVPIHPFFKNNTIAICISFSIICTACAMDRISLLLNPDREGDPWLSVIFPFYFIGRLLLSLIFIGRLHYTFRGSMFEYSRCTMNALKSTWCMMAVSACLGTLLSIPAFDSMLAGMLFSSLLILIDIVLSWVLLYLYAKKLYILISKRDEFLLSVMTKYALLYTVCFGSTFAVFLMAVINLVSVATGSPVFYGEDVIIFLSVDSLVNAVCLWLSLRFAAAWYDRLCGWGDTQCTKCCRSCSNDVEKNQNMMKEVIVLADVHVYKEKRKAEITESMKVESSLNQAVIF